MKRKSCFIIGLPSAGKTTYLAALWYSLQQKNKTLLQLKKFTGNQKYLTDLSNTWAGLEKVSRTSIDNEQENLTVLLKNSDDELLEITFPDLSGESFQKQYTDREMKKETAEKILSTDGFLIFINPIETTLPCMILNINYDTRHADDNNIVASRNPIKDDPTEVQLVEIVQFIREIKGDKKCNLAIIVSAWDLKDANKFKRPEEYVKDQLPLLWQYLYANKSAWCCRYFGISAQGGPLETQEDINLLSDISDPIDRIKVMDNDGNEHNDITIPLCSILTMKEGE